MGFKKVMPLIIEDFKQAAIDYALIGGFAMGALGVMRSTMDVDFLVKAEDLEKVAAIMERYGYRCLHKTENVSQYVADMKIFGQMDFIHAFRPLSLSMLKRAKPVLVFEGKHSIKVLIPEDIIGLKIQAVGNDASRATREYADIERIMGHYREKLDWELLQDYFSLFKKKGKFKKLKEHYDKAQ